MRMGISKGMPPCRSPFVRRTPGHSVRDCVTSNKNRSCNEFGQMPNRVSSMLDVVVDSFQLSERGPSGWGGWWENPRPQLDRWAIPAFPSVLFPILPNFSSCCWGSRTETGQFVGALFHYRTVIVNEERRVEWKVGVWEGCRRHHNKRVFVNR